MFVLQRLHFQELMSSIQEHFKDMALDRRAYPGLQSESSPSKSSASSPSLRARESEVVPMNRTTLDNGGGNVRVVVRVRGFLPRGSFLYVPNSDNADIRKEIERGAECLVEMNPDTQGTTLLVPNSTDPANSRTQSRKVIEEKKFIFDNSFWSHNTSDEHYAHQEDIYNALGEEFLDHNFEGYHTCIFAYGQTGSGKSYTMMGTADQPGLIPRTCEDLFQRIGSSPSPNVSYTVHVSYFEVYNEHVRDLLSSRPPPASASTANGSTYYLKIRESPTEGPYIKDLSNMPVKSYAEILKYMRLGDASRTTASTKMNDTSSRSHAVFTIMLKQIHHDLETDSTTERVARIRLVDLAGSERAKATEATGQRLREGSNINKSLTTLGRVIAALADPKHGRIHSGRKGASRDVVPYRDSILTWLLKDSLGGNSKTAMIACISPSDYDETLSTLRYADQAKHIRTRATINQDSVSAAERDAQILAMQNTIRELQVQVSLANQAAAESASTSRRHALTESRDSTKRDEKLEEYQEKVERMQRLMEEERLVGESKIRQLVEQNEALRLHLKLAVESLKNPIRSPTPAPLPPHELTPERDIAESIEPSSPPSHGNQQSTTNLVSSSPNNPVTTTDNNKENSSPSPHEPSQSLQPQHHLPPPSLTPSHIPAYPDPYPHEHDNTSALDAKRDAEALEMQAHMEELLSDLGLFRRKVADDHQRFGSRSAKENQQQQMTKKNNKKKKQGMQGMRKGGQDMGGEWERGRRDVLGELGGNLNI